jgi:hypothetical protein
MTDITIPPEALEALQEFVMERHGCLLSDDEAYAACLAMLKNWPGMVEKRANENLLLANLNPAIILPLTETPNDK